MIRDDRLAAGTVGRLIQWLFGDVPWVRAALDLPGPGWRHRFQHGVGRSPLTAAAGVCSPHGIREEERVGQAAGPIYSPSQIPFLDSKGPNGKCGPGIVQ